LSVEREPACEERSQSKFRDRSFHKDSVKRCRARQSEPLVESEFPVLYKIL
jgi:hypothetical protein